MKSAFGIICGWQLTLLMLATISGITAGESRFSSDGQNDAKSIAIAGPNRAATFMVSTDAEGHLTYSIGSADNARVLPARAGIIVDGIDLGASVEVGTPRLKGISETFICRGNKTRGTNSCEVAEIPIYSQESRKRWTFEVRVFDDGAAFRYVIPGAGARRIVGESTAWRLPSDSTVWYQTNTVNYEGLYQQSSAEALPRESTHLGPPLTIRFRDGVYGLLSEASLYNYSGMTFASVGGGSLQAAFEDDPKGWTNQGSIVSPWRVLIVSPDLNGLINSDLIFALAEPPEAKLFPEGSETSWICPGKAPCTWMVFGNNGAQWQQQKWFVDMASAIGCEYLLVDAGWRTEQWGWLKDGNDPWQRAAELCRYAAERNVGILLWHAYPEGRDDGPGLTTAEAREDFLRHCAQSGVKGVKIDFFDSESKETIDAYEDLLRRSAKYKVMINFHGANKPTGESRTWPHEMTREGIREQEYVLWDSLPLSHYGTLPFTRLAIGHGDFLPGYVQSRFLKNTAVTFQMASAVIFSSPMLCWPDNPEAYLNSPFLSFIRNLPVTWDETRVLPNSVIGETVAMARRKGSEWYVAVLNCKNEAQVLEIDFSSLGCQDQLLTVYLDNPSDGGCEIHSGVAVPSSRRLTVTIRSGGGFIAQVNTPKKFKGWR